MKRKLNKQEVEIYKKQLAENTEDIQVLEGEKKRLDFNMDFLLDHNYKKAKREIEKEQKGIYLKLKQAKFIVNALEDHLKNGVDEKEEKDGGHN